ncbi:MAG: oxygen-dependent coproporphyrinogen oxidase, partial [Bacteroidota bacterium]
MNISKEHVSNYFKELQDDICTTLETADGKGRFKEDSWSRPGGGGGRSRVIEGQVIEKGGVNFSAVHGKMPDQVAAKLEMKGGDFFATGVSIVLHPHHPMMPIIHMNVRYFEKDDGIWWFGGGIDLTPHYIDREEARYFHTQLKSVCDKHHSDYYPKFKTWADDYFYIKHRQETRGIGGIFFDRLSTQDGFTKSERFNFVRDVGTSFAPIYTSFMQKNGASTFHPHQKQWQLLRRGRYVEFNLVWDRGTKFGLETNGRTESILMSMPPQANWVYDFKVEAESKEAATLA